MTIHVTVLYSPGSREVVEVTLTLPEGSTALQALAASGLQARFPGLTLQGDSLGVWGRRVTPGHRLRDEDRVEIYRPLKVDPKRARRERFQKQGARTTGLFARRRPGGKAGY